MRKFMNLPTLLSGLAFTVCALIVPSGTLLAQNADEEVEEVIVTGTRIKSENVIAASPVTTIGTEEISLKMTPNIERVFRDMPITIPGDGENVNNGTQGQATLDLRGLGPGRSLVLVDGQRLSPFDINGEVSTDVIPIIMLERVDVVTGGASAVYGSDAMSGAVNFILNHDFEGFQIEYGWSDTDSGEAVGSGGGDSYYTQAMFGASMAEDRGHIVVGGGYTDRGAVLLGDRSFGVYGVSSTTGSGLGAAPPAPDASCSGNSDFTTAHSSGVGSTTAIPATMNLRSGSSYQFRDDGSIPAFTTVGVSTECARFNFNPFNYYQTPQKRWQATTIASYDFNDNVEFYGRGSFVSNASAFRIAPSGTFGQTFTIPLMNPFFTDATRQTIISDLNAFATSQAGVSPGDPLGFTAAGIVDNDNNGVFDANDSFLSTARRRTIELGPRTGDFKTNFYQYVLGARGELPGAMEGWNYDLSYSYGVSDFVETRDGFTNLTNLQTGINTVDATQCITPAGVVTAPPCSPINVFGPEGSITDEQRESGYFIAIASDLRKATQTIYHASIDGTIDALRLPTADEGLSVAVGFEHSRTTANSSPDECLKLVPASCQGGAGGNRLPVNGRYSSDEWFMEAILPIVQGRSGFENLNVELGYRNADYDVQGGTDTWKAGFGWEFIQGLRFRYMEQKAVRVPNVGELFRPVTTGLDNATLDPCSIGNPNPPAPGSDLFNLCVQTGVPASQVGTVPDIISGQINVFSGTNPNALPSPEEARTTTYGFVWEPEVGFLTNTVLSLDYYDIKVEDYIDTPTGQESLDLCYVLHDPVYCSAIVRIGGQLNISGAGTPAYYTNFTRYEAEGIDFIASAGFEAGNIGDFTVDLTTHKYLTNEFQTTAVSPVVDCKGYYGTSCDPVPEWRHTLRVHWYRNDMDASLLWRHISSMDAQTNEAASLFEAFRSVSSEDYFDLTFGYNYRDWGRVSLMIYNVLDEDPPILGNETGSTSFNSGNTFPSLYDTMGRTYGFNVKVTF